MKSHEVPSIVASISVEKPAEESIEQAEHLITKREATPEDRDFASKVYYSAYKDVVTRQIQGVNYDKTQAYYFDKMWIPKRFKIILDNESACGLLWVEDMSDCIFVHELVVAPESQGLGIGTKMIHEIIQRSRERNVPIKLDVLKENKARGLYERMGFVKNGESSTQFRMERAPDLDSKE